MGREIRLAAVGDNCMDVYDARGEAFPGGNPVNVAVYTRRLGGAASYVGVVGDDHYGEVMRAAIAAKGVDVSHLRALPGATAVTHVSMDGGERLLGDYEEGVMGLFRLDGADLDFLCGHDLIVTGLWGRVEGDLPLLRRRRVPVAFDFADKEEHPVIDAALPYVDYAFFSRDEGGEEELGAFLREMCGRGPKLAVVTLGERGSLACDGGALYRQDVVPCPVVDTMGAGDSYIAGFLYGLMRGKALPECMRHGAACSAVTLGYAGAW